MSFRQGDPDNDTQFFRQLDDRIRRLESARADQSKVSTKELRLRSAKRLTSMMVIGDSISQFDRCNTFSAQAWRNTDEPSQYRWQDQIADHLAGRSGVKRILPEVIGPFVEPSPGAMPNLTGTPKMTTSGTGAFTQWDYSIPGAHADWWMEQVLPHYAPPAMPVDILFVMLGANDLFLGKHPTEVFGPAMEQILNTYPHRHACVIIPWRSGLHPDPPHAWSEYVTVMRDLASTDNRLIVVEPVAGTPSSEYAYDGVHPTQAGHDIIASEVRSVLTGLENASAARVSITASRMGAEIEGGLIIGNWRPNANAAGKLVATNLLTNQDTVLG